MTQEQRERRMGRGIVAIMAGCGVTTDRGHDPLNCDESALVDALTNIMHACDCPDVDVDFDTALAKAREHYANERAAS